MLRILPKSWGLAIPILSFSIREDFSHTEAQRSQSALSSVPLRLREIQFLSHIVELWRAVRRCPEATGSDYYLSLSFGKSSGRSNSLSMSDLVGP